MATVASSPYRILQVEGPSFRIAQLLSALIVAIDNIVEGHYYIVDLETVEEIESDIKSQFGWHLTKSLEPFEMEQIVLKLEYFLNFICIILSSDLAPNLENQEVDCNLMYQVPERLVYQPSLAQLEVRDMNVLLIICTTQLAEVLLLAISNHPSCEFVTVVRNEAYVE